MMTMYQKGTGGGPGAPQNFVDWQNCHGSYIVNYTNQKESEFYLTVVFMWDKKHNFPLKPSSGPMLPGVGVEDEKIVIDEFNSPQRGNASTSHTRSDKHNGQRYLICNQTAYQCPSSTSELIKAPVNGKASAKTSTSDKQYELVGRISGMRKEIKESENDINDLKVKRNRIEETYKDYPDKKQKKLKNINDEIK